MRDACGWYDGRRSRWKSNDEAAFPEDEVAAERGVEIAKGGYRAAAKRKVIGVQVSETGCFGTEVDSGGGPWTFRKIGAEVRVAFEKRIAAAGVVFELLRHP